jgi:hypothetical protein
MPCCGQKREHVTPAPPPQRVQPRPMAPARSAPPPPITFEYTGKTSLAVTGPITRASYRFLAPGAMVPVDARDAGAVAAVPNVRRIAR